MKDNYTHITLVVDRSGSMSSIKNDAQGGINEFIKANKALASDCTFMLYEFDNVIDKVFIGDIQDAPDYHLDPRGATALLDAQWRAINETGKYLEFMPEDQRPSKVIFLTVTDGGENASTELYGPAGAAKLKGKIEEQTNIYKWEFAYIGANQDAFSVGASMGYNTTTTYAGTGASTRAMYSSMTDSTLSLRSKGTPLSATLASVVDAAGNITPSKQATTKDEEEE